MFAWSIPFPNFQKEVTRRVEEEADSLEVESSHEVSEHEEWLRNFAIKMPAKNEQGHVD